MPHIYRDLISFSLGGIEGLEKQIKEEEDAKKTINEMNEEIKEPQPG